MCLPMCLVIISECSAATCPINSPVSLYTASECQQSETKWAMLLLGIVEVSAGLETVVSKSCQIAFVHFYLHTFVGQWHNWVSVYAA